MLAVAAAATAITAPAAVATSESPTVSCASEGWIHTVRQNGEYWVFAHGDPANGGFAWYGPQPTRIGTGWSGRTLVGRGGSVHNITDSGELRKFSFNGREFRQLPHGGQYDVIGSDWQLYTSAAYRNRITFDSEGALFTIDQQGDLRWWYFDEAHQGWHPESGRVLATGWGQYDMITAAGPGVLQARRSDGAMTRFRYHQGSQRWIRENTSSGQGWQMFEKMFSMGGDVLYGVNRYNGDLLWYGYDEASNRWVADTGRLAGRDWAGLRDIGANTWNCRSKTMRSPEEHGLSGSTYPPAVVDSDLGVLHTFQVKNDSLVHGTMTDPASFRSTTAPGQVYGNVLRPHVSSTGVAEVYGTERFGASANRWSADGQWQQRQEHAGYLSHAPAVHRRANGTVALYGVVDGQLWLREGTLPWRALGGTDLSGYATIGKQTDSSVNLFVRNTRGELFEVTHTASGLGEFQQFGNGILLYSDGVTAVADGAGQVWVAGQSQQGHVIVAGAGRSWNQLGYYNTSSPALARDADGKVTIVARKFNGKWERTTQAAPGSGEFGPWTEIETGDTETTSDPALIFRRTGEMALLYRHGTQSLRYCSLAAQATCTNLD
ncbi:tachylectin-related carbohydrate-binding protein [Lentzea tibetensis]|uniref:tachylectin-related carbohydrate-binding protein n=1 Tax=Lentzea tibetensis TaxID=2591470 RepID=UPI001644C203|nr:tachylectin-related carbohydrate-binding protein [Lentzea tibetensis]